MAMARGGRPVRRGQDRCTAVQQALDAVGAQGEVGERAASAQGISGRDAVALRLEPRRHQARDLGPLAMLQKVAHRQTHIVRAVRVDCGGQRAAGKRGAQRTAHHSAHRGVKTGRRVNRRARAGEQASTDTDTGTDGERAGGNHTFRNRVFAGGRDRATSKTVNLGHPDLDPWHPRALIFWHRPLQKS